MSDRFLEIMKKNLLTSRFFLFYGILWLILIAIQFILRLAISINYLEAISYQIWFAGFMQDLSWSSYGLILILITGLFAKRIGEKIMLFIWLLISVLTNFSDAILLKQWGSRINAQALFYLNNLNESVASLDMVQWIILVLLFAVVFIFSFWGYKQLNRIINPEISMRYAKTAILICAFAIAARGGLGKSPLTIENAMRFNTNLENQLALNSPWNFIYSIIQGNQIPDVSHFRDSTYYFESQIENLFPEGNHKQDSFSKKKPHIILIVLEGVSAELSKHFNGKIASVTPNMDKIAREGLSFTRAYATGDRTDKGLVSIFSGWPGHPWQGMLAFPEKAAKLPNLISDLKSLGYYTSFYYGSDLSFANQRFYFQQSGIDEIQDVKTLNSQSQFKLGSWGIHDAEMLNILTNQFLSKQSSNIPQFLSLLTLSTHDPYDAISDNTGSESQKMIKTVEYLDRELGKFYHQIRQSKEYQNTLIVLVSDHGKNLQTPETHFGQRDFFHIPLIFAGGALDNRYKNRVEDRVVSQTDLYATLLHLLGWTHKEIQYSFSKGYRSLLKYSRSGIGSNHPGFAWFNIPSVTGIIKQNEIFWLGTDKMSINAEKPLNQQDSSILSLSTVIVNDFFDLQ